jgi:transcriptional regulator with XRE-family HTH domain
MSDRDGIGRCIATYRRRRGLSQAALAGLVGRSESWLSQVERGVRSVDRMSVLLDLARVLHVEVDALIGRPWQLAPNGNTIADALSEVRGALTNYSALLGRPSAQVSNLAQLRSKVADVHRTYQAARYDEVVTVLPGVLAAVEGFPGRRNGERREALLAYVSAYAVAAKLVTKLGAGDLALLAADRAATAAVTQRVEPREAWRVISWLVPCFKRIRWRTGSG